ncbi:hypothetical protein PSECIP111951_01151 [Pseudoalteromonas holothuriae]|uniref:Major tropism determinant N-terminal domain-containing protein n=1 Tax=Pseudoalteromonas holothuriae TaxID=2963714 RepID=A0ABM9GFU5_9GAMM|nr:hypothetical protein [Pseudoalteromonas sp. CIP111951]CAH9054995.1 hypothetical protein PSECIP111951_01151 [Pseudoalteromonas sp. CIP111951]
MGRKIQFRRGPESERLQTVLANGEPGWSPEAEQLFIGDGQTLGGVPVDMGKFTLVDQPTLAVAGGRYLFTSVTTLQLPNSAFEGAVVSVMLDSNSGATRENPARVLASYGRLITDNASNSDAEYHLTIPGIERSFIFIDGGWKICH